MPQNSRFMNVDETVGGERTNALKLVIPDEIQTEAERQRIDEQDRMDAEENMVTAMVSSSAVVSVSSKRRSRPPAIPPPPHSSFMMPPPKRWTSRATRTVVLTVAFVAAISAGTAVVLKDQLSLTQASLTPNLSKRSIRYHNNYYNHRMQQSKHSSGVAVPDIFENNLRGFHEPPSAIRAKKMPLLWRIPMSGDETISRAMGVCLNQVLAADQTESLRNVKPLTAELDVVSTPHGRIVNIDLNSKTGMTVAESLRLLSLDIVHSMTTPHLLGAVQMMAQQNTKGQVFAMFRHPVDRLGDYFRAVTDRSSRYYDPELHGKTIEQYANWPTDRPEFNFMTKSLVSSGEYLVASRDLTPQDLELAKAIVKEKFLVLLTQDKLGSWLKLSSWMGWRTTQDQQGCIDRLLMEKTERPPVDSQSRWYIRMSERNGWDVQLYRYVADLYQHQTESLVN